MSYNFPKPGDPVSTPITPLPNQTDPASVPGGFAQVNPANTTSATTDANGVLEIVPITTAEVLSVSAQTSAPGYEVALVPSTGDWAIIAKVGLLGTPGVTGGDVAAFIGVYAPAGTITIGAEVRFAPGGTLYDIVSYNGATSAAYPGFTQAQIEGEVWFRVTMRSRSMLIAEYGIAVGDVEPTTWLPMTVVLGTITTGYLLQMNVWRWSTPTGTAPTGTFSHIRIVETPLFT